MRWLVLMGLLTVSCLPPHSEPIDPVPEIYLDFPELAQWGHVVLIGGREYWRPDPAHFVLVPPYRHTAPPHDAWMPYGNGYFYEDPVEGLVWASYDPWGFITSHYGYWRHHVQLGYLWRPLYPLTWRPYVATVLHDEGGFIFGMCPFSLVVWDSGLYGLGAGFDDTYWDPFWSGVENHGFYDSHRHRFDNYSVSFTSYNARVHWRDEPESHFRHDRDYRERRRHPGSRDEDPLEDRQRQRGEPPVEPLTVGEGLPARPVVTPPTPERSGGDSSPPAPAGLPTISPRRLDPKRERAEKEPPRLPVDREELRPAPTQQPARPGTNPPSPGSMPMGPGSEEGDELGDERDRGSGITRRRTETPTVEPQREARPAVEPRPDASAPAAEKRGVSAPVETRRDAALVVIPKGEVSVPVETKHHAGVPVAPKDEVSVPAETKHDTAVPVAPGRQVLRTPEPKRVTPSAPASRLVRDSIAVEPAPATKEQAAPGQPAPEKKETTADSRTKQEEKSSDAKERAKKAMDTQKKEKK